MWITLKSPSPVHQDREPSGKSYSDFLNVYRDLRLNYAVLTDEEKESARGRQLREQILKIKDEIMIIQDKHLK
jgi:hypothetical protein